MNIDEAELSLRLYSTSSWTGALNTPHTLLLLLPSVRVTLSSYYFHIACMDRLVTYSRRRSYARLDILMDAFLLFMVLRSATSRLYHYHPRFFRWFGNTLHLGRSPGNFMVLLILKILWHIDVHRISSQPMHVPQRLTSYMYPSRVIHHSELTSTDNPLTLVLRFCTNSSTISLGPYVSAQDTVQ
jgi:hypothetical protein